MTTPLGHTPGFTLWLLGPTSSGKTTIAEMLTAQLRASGVMVLHYDGDEVRNFFGENHGFTAADRMRVVSTLIHLANKATQSGAHVIVSALTANEDARCQVRDQVNGLITSYITCPIEVCAARDPKGLYAQANSGEIDTLIGVNSEYRAPVNPDIVIDTDHLSATDGVDALIGHLRSVGFEL
jgi:adenylylsulfate kinase